MNDNSFRLGYDECRAALLERLAEPAPARIQLLGGPRQVGKTTLLLEVAEKLGDVAIYAAGDAPEAMLPGFFERLWIRAEQTASTAGRAVVLLDEAHLVRDWAKRLKSACDSLRRRRIPVHVVATGSSALRLASGSKESLAGRFERLTLGHWPASELARAFRIAPDAAAEIVVCEGAYPGAFPLRADRARFTAYVRDAIVEPALGRDLLALAPIRRPALLRQLFALAATFPAQVVSLQKLRGALEDRGALETIAQYLSLLEEAFLVVALPKYAARELRRRAAPPKLVVLSNALLVAADPAGSPERSTDPARYGRWVENACLAHAWNMGQRVSYWREEPLEVDGVIEGSWGAWVVEVKTGGFGAQDLRGLLEFARRHPRFTPIVLTDGPGRIVAERAGVASLLWQEFLCSRGPGV